METTAGKPTERDRSLRELATIPGVGQSIARDLWDIGIRRVADLKDEDPQSLYERSNRRAGIDQDRCLLYVFRCAVYYARTPEGKREPEKLKWWNWKAER